MQVNLSEEVTALIEELLRSGNKTLAAERMLTAAALLQNLFVLLNTHGDTSRNHELLRLIGRLAVRTAELLGDTSPEAAMVAELDAEANHAVGAGANQ